MINEYKKTLLRRQAILDGFKAMYLSTHGMAAKLQNGPETAIYMEGYEDALSAAAELIGMGAEFDALLAEAKSRPIKAALIIAAEPDLVKSP